MFKTSKKNKKKCQFSVDNPCCYAAHNPPDKLEDTEKIFGLAGQRVGSISKPSKSSRGRKKKPGSNQTPCENIKNPHIS